MAILQKRTSTKRLPSARRLDRPPLTSAIQQAGRAQPNVVNLGGKRSDFDPMRNMTSSAVQPQPKINQRQIIANKTITPTATEKPAQRAVTTKPTLTSKTTNPSTKVTTPIAKTIRRNLASHQLMLRPLTRPKQRRPIRLPNQP